jgi:hypothetical protein
LKELKNKNNSINKWYFSIWCFYLVFHYFKMNTII